MNGSNLWAENWMLSLILVRQHLWEQNRWKQTVFINLMTMVARGSTFGLKPWKRGVWASSSILFFLCPFLLSFFYPDTIFELPSSVLNPRLFLLSFQLDSEAFSILKVNDHNYDEVDNLTLDRNKLETLPEKLLEMKLGLSFSAKHNQLTSVSNLFCRA